MTFERTTLQRVSFAASLLMALIVASAPQTYSATAITEQTSFSGYGQTAAEHQLAVPGFGLPIQTLGTGLSGTVASIAYRVKGAAIADDLVNGFGDVYIVSCPTNTYSGCIFQISSTARTVVSQSGSEAVVNASFDTSYSFNPSLYYFLLFVTDHDLQVGGTSSDGYGAGEAKWFESDGIYTTDPNIVDIAFSICSTSDCDVVAPPPADTTAPVVTITGGNFSTATPTLMGSTTDPSSPVTVLVNNHFYSTTTLTDSWYVGVDTIPDGEYTALASSTDTALNASPEVSAAVTIDTTAPSLTIDSGPTQDSTATSTPVIFTFTASDAHLSGTTCSYNGGTAESCASPFATSTLADGTHSFTVTASDSFGFSTSVTRSFTLDTTPEVATTTEPTATTTETTPTPTPEPAATQTVSGGGSAGNGVVDGPLSVGYQTPFVPAVVIPTAPTGEVLGATTPEPQAPSPVLAASYAVSATEPLPPPQEDATAFDLPTFEDPWQPTPAPKTEPVELTAAVAQSELAAPWWAWALGVLALFLMLLGAYRRLA